MNSIHPYYQIYYTCDSYVCDLTKYLESSGLCRTRNRYGNMLFCHMRPLCLSSWFDSPYTPNVCMITNTLILEFECFSIYYLYIFTKKINKDLYHLSIILSTSFAQFGTRWCVKKNGLLCLEASTQLISTSYLIQTAETLVHYLHKQNDFSHYSLCVCVVFDSMMVHY